MHDGAKTILIVEDDADFRMTLQEVLEQEGYPVAAAQHGKEALDYLSHSPAPGLILLDLMMPVMDGWQFREEQARDPRLASIPVLVMTAFRDREMFLYSTGVIFKPVDLPSLLLHIERLVGPPPSDVPANGSGPTMID